jgi:hypothetical protein
MGGSQLLNAPPKLLNQFFQPMALPANIFYEDVQSLEFVGLERGHSGQVPPTCAEMVLIAMRTNRRVLELLAGVMFCLACDHRSGVSAFSDWNFKNTDIPIEMNVRLPILRAR